MVNTAFVSDVDGNGLQETNTDPNIVRSAVEPQGREPPPNQTGVTQSSRVVSIRRSLTAEGISEEASVLILSSWRHRTENAYSSSWRRWEQWCSINGFQPVHSPLNAILEFLTAEFHQGKQYRTINSYRSAISMTHEKIDGVLVGKHPLVSRLLKGVYNQRPPQPRYSTTWDVGVVLDHMRSWGRTADLSDKKLTLKVAMLLALANASRCSELHALDTQHMSWSEEGVTFTLAALTKTSRPGKEKTLFYPKLEANKFAQLPPLNSMLKERIESEMSVPSFSHT